jgi:hypothetical protein
VGAAFIVRGRLVGAELFDSPRTFAQLLPKLVRRYGLDALDHSLPRDSGRMERPRRRFQCQLGSCHSVGMRNLL